MKATVRLERVLVLPEDLEIGDRLIIENKAQEIVSFDVPNGNSSRTRGVKTEDLGSGEQVHYLKLGVPYSVEIMHRQVITKGSTIL